MVGSYALIALEGLDLPAPIPNSQFAVTNGSLQLRSGRTFEFRYVTYDTAAVSASLEAVMTGTYDVLDEFTAEFTSLELTMNTAPSPKPEAPFLGVVQGDSLTLTDPNGGRWLFRRLHP
jgi:hypothetical protein